MKYETLSKYISGRQTGTPYGDGKDTKRYSSEKAKVKISK